MPDEEKPGKPTRSPPSRLRRLLAALFCCITVQTPEVEEAEPYVPEGFYYSFTGTDLREVRLISWLNSFLKDEELYIKKLVDLASGLSLLRVVEGLFQVHIDSPADGPKFHTCKAKRRRKLEKRTIKAVVKFLKTVEQLKLGDVSAVDIYKGNYEVIRKVALLMHQYFFKYKQKPSQRPPGQDPNFIHLPQITCQIPAVSPTVKHLCGRFTESDVLWDLENKADLSNESLQVNVEVITNIRNEWTFIGVQEGNVPGMKVVGTKPAVYLQRGNFSRRSEPCNEPPVWFDRTFDSIDDEEGCEIPDRELVTGVLEKSIMCDALSFDFIPCETPLSEVDMTGWDENWSCDEYMSSCVLGEEEGLDRLAEELAHACILNAVYCLQTQYNLSASK